MKVSYLLTVFLSIGILSGVFASCSATGATASTNDISSEITLDNQSTSDNTSEDVEVTGLDFPDEEPKKYGEDSAQCVMNLSLYKQSYKFWRQSSYDTLYFWELIKPWQYVVYNCPLASKNAFKRADLIMSHYIKFAKTDEQKQDRIDSLMIIYDIRMDVYGDRANVQSRKANAMMKYRPTDTIACYNEFKQAVEDAGNKLQAPTILYSMVYSLGALRHDSIDLSEVIDLYFKLTAAAEYNIEKGKEVEMYEDVVNKIDQLILGYIDCDILEQVFGPKIEAGTDDVDFLEKVVAFFHLKECTYSDIFKNALNQLTALKPSPKLLLMNARIASNDGDYEKANAEIDRALDEFTEEEVDEKFDAYMLKARINKDAGLYSTAKAAIMGALSVKPDNYDAYMLLGSIYSSATSCGSGPYKSNVGYLAAYEAFNKAKSCTDNESLKSDAAKKANSMIGGFPTKEDIHFRNDNEKIGKRISSGCWIGDVILRGK